jgi:Rod binding domain-containing protein
MTTSPDIANAMSMARSTPVTAPHAGRTMDATKKAAKEFESVFISQFLGGMFEGVQTDGMFGGGEGEQMFRSLMLDQYGKKIADQGGFGLADAITKSLVNRQQQQERAAQLAQAKADGKAEPTDAAAAPIATQKAQPIFAAHPAAASAMATAPKTAPLFAAHPATLFAASAAASTLTSQSAAR